MESTWAGRFNAFAAKANHWLGQPVAFVLACALVVAWAASGPFMGFSDSWSLLINTGTTIVTFLMVFLLQSSQNTLQAESDRREKALNLKIDALIKAQDGVEDRLMSLENESDEVIEEVAEELRGARELLPRDLGDEEPYRDE